MQCRKNEKEKVWFRSDRCFSVDSKWFFTTREGHDVGPFVTREKAERGVHRYIESIKMKKTGGIYAARVATQGLWASTGYN